MVEIALVVAFVVLSLPLSDNGLVLKYFGSIVFQVAGDVEIREFYGAQPTQHIPIRNLWMVKLITFMIIIC